MVPANETRMRTCVGLAAAVTGAVDTQPIFACHLPGEAQTNQRSELYALLKVLEREPHRAIEVRSDSRYVVDGFAADVQMG